MSYVYIVECEDGSLYTGIAKDIYKRMREHIEKKSVGAKYTKSHTVKKIRAVWKVQDFKTAAKLEYAIKHIPRKDKLLLVDIPNSVKEVLPKFQEEIIEYVPDITLEECLLKSEKQQTKTGV